MPCRQIAFDLGRPGPLGHGDPDCRRRPVFGLPLPDLAGYPVQFVVPGRVAAELRSRAAEHGAVAVQGVAAAVEVVPRLAAEQRFGDGEDLVGAAVAERQPVERPRIAMPRLPSET